MKTLSSTNRRGFLRSGSSLIALPFLESIGFSKLASAAPTLPTAPKRMIFLGMGFGVTREKWYPKKSDTGANYQLPELLSPLQKHKSDLTIIQNLQNQYNNEAHWGSTFWLTGANRYEIPGQSFHNTISVDQVAAEQFGKETRFSSIQLDSKGGAGHGPGSSLAWNRQGKPISAYRTPVAAYHRLFSDEKTPLAKRQQMLRDQKSVLDTVLDDARSMSKGLTKTDVQKVDEYFQSIREIEIRLAKEEQWLEVPKKQPKKRVKVPQESLEGVKEVEMMYDLMLAAMQVDATRVFSYRMPVDSFISSLGATITGHNMSHYGNGERRVVSELRDRTHAELLSKFIDKMKASKEPDGSSLFDNTVLTFGSNISSIHYLNNCPTIVAGGGAGINHGRHLVMSDPKTPLCNLWLSLLNGVGINAQSHGDSTGVIEELFEA